MDKTSSPGSNRNYLDLLSEYELLRDANGFESTSDYTNIDILKNINIDNITKCYRAQQSGSAAIIKLLDAIDIMLDNISLYQYFANHMANYIIYNQCKASVIDNNIVKDVNNFIRVLRNNNNRKQVSKALIMLT